MSKFHDNLTFSSEVTEVLARQLLSFSQQWIKQFRVLIKHCFLMGKNTVEAKQWLDKRYGDPAPGKSTIDWYAEFKRGRTNTLKISEGSVFTILHESLGMRELFSKWVLRLLTPDQKQQYVEDSERNYNG